MIVSFIRTVLLYGVILFAVRLMGKRQISQLQTSELVVTLLISDIAAIPMQNTAQPLVSGILPIFILIVCEIFLSLLMLKSHRFHRFVCGKPIAVIEEGKIRQDNLRLLRMTAEDLAEQLRQKEVSSFSEVNYAFMEPNGQLSVIKKQKASPLTPNMLCMPVKENELEVLVVVGGAFADSSLQICGKDREWAKKILKKNKVLLADVFLMTADKNGNYRIIQKEAKK